jgi:hypothetical protein
MTARRWLAAGAMALMAGSGLAQEAPPDTTPPARPAAPEPAPPEEGLLSADELDSLLAPIALFPDPLLNQILVAATVPLDVVRADRWVAANADLPKAERSEAAAAEGWDPSVAVLAAGFPAVVQRMAADLDATESLGDAVLAQTDDVLDSVQRLRAQAAAAGNLESNEAQTVSEDAEGDIAVTPADPEVVYVPSYDPAAAFAAPATATMAPAYVAPGIDTGTMITSGAIAFGTAMLVDEIFDDDDDDWDDYWGPGSIDWDDDAIYHRPNIDVEGDVNIDRDRVVIDRDRIGDLDPDRIRDGSWKPDPAQRAQARARLEQRRAERPREERHARLGDHDGAQGAAAADAAGGGAARAKLERSAARRDAAPPRKAARNTALSPKHQGAPRIERERARGASSARVSHAAVSKPKAMSKPHKPRPAVHKAAPKKHSAFKPSHGGAKARAASHRGRSSSKQHAGIRRR